MLDLIMLTIVVMTVIGVICLVRLSLGLSDALVDLKCHCTEVSDTTRRAILGRLRLGDYTDSQRVVEEVVVLRGDLARAETKHERATAQCAKLAARLNRAEAKIERLKAESADGVAPCDGRRVPNPFIYGGSNPKPLFDTKVSAVEKAILRGVVDDDRVNIIVDDDTDLTQLVDDIPAAAKAPQKYGVCTTCIFHGDNSKYPCPSCENGLYHRGRND